MGNYHHSVCFLITCIQFIRESLIVRIVPVLNPVRTYSKQKARILPTSHPGLLNWINNLLKNSRSNAGTYIFIWETDNNFSSDEKLTLEFYLTRKSTENNFLTEKRSNRNFRTSEILNLINGWAKRIHTWGKNSWYQ